MFLKQQVISALQAEVKGDIVSQVATKMFEELDTPFSLSCAILLRNKEYAQLVNKSCRLDGETPEKDILASDLLSKFTGFKHPDLDPCATAAVSFLAGEEHCRQTNARLRKFVRDADDTDDNYVLLRDIHDEIAGILGDFDANEWLSLMSFGPGKSLGTDSERVSPYYKMLARPTYCGQDLELADQVVKACPSWAEVGKPIMPVAAAKLSFVPKSAKTLRSILVEPIVNIFMQKGLGKMMRKRLKRVACDLDFGQQTQRDLARYGSYSGAVCTLDLRNASNTICSVLPRLLLEPKWYAAFASCRSHSYRDDSGVHRLNMFSSMGNGFTFELESLIYYALVRVIVRRRCGTKGLFLSGVFGDDIIVPVECLDSLKKAISFLGFIINEPKTHSEGYFRESCGGNYYGGSEVSTFYIKAPCNDVSDLFRLANRLHDRAISATSAEVKRCLERGRRVVVAAIPRPARCLRYPDYLGVQDSGLAVPVSELNFDSRDKDLQVWAHKSYAWVRGPLNFRMENLWAARASLLYNVEYSRDDSEKQSSISIRGVRNKVKLFAEFGLTPHRGRNTARLCTVFYYEHGGHTL